MAAQHAYDHKAGETTPDNPPQSPVYPRGTVSIAPIPEGVEMQAQVLIHEAGSAALAKVAVDGAAERELISDFREDSFGKRFGFASRPELLAASTPLIGADGTAWWTTAIADDRWIVWNQDDMSAAQTFATLDEARRSVYGPVLESGVS